MASSTRPEAKQLGELLKQQQEPFILEIYLSERGCLKKKKLTTSKAKYPSIGCHGSSSTSTKLLKKNLKVVIFNKLFPSKGLKPQNSDDENGKIGVTEMKRNDQEIAKPDRFSTASCTTMHHSCLDTDIDEPLKLCNEREKQVVADSKFQWSSMEDSKQDSPQSVLEDMFSTSTSSPIEKTRRVSSLFLSKLIMEDSILSASLWKLLLQTRPGFRELQKADDGSNSSPFSISKQQTNKVPSHNNEKAPFEKTKDSVKSYGDESSNIMKLLESDVTDSTQEWNNYEQQKKDVGLVIGNAIAEEITTEVVMDMIFKVL